MSIALRHAALQIRLFLRSPMFVITVLSYPALLFSFIGIPFSDTTIAAEQEMLGFAALATLTNTFFMLGTGLAATRASHWEKWLRTLPVGAGARIAGRVLGTLPFAVISAGGVVALALVATPVRLGITQWGGLAVLVLVGFVSFGSCALALGYWLTPMSAAPVISVVVLFLAYAGNLWTSTRPLPGRFARIAAYTPTSYWHRLMIAVIDGGPVASASAALTGYTLLFLALAVLGFQRDSKRTPWMLQ